MGRDEKIRVCHIISGDLWAGAEVQAYTLLKTLAANPVLKLSVIILNDGKLAEKLRRTAVETFVIDEAKHRFPAILKKSREYLDGKGIDIIHSHRRKENVLAGLLRRSHHAAHAVQTVHGASEPFKGVKWLKEKVYAVLNRYSTNHYFDHILPVSDDLRMLISEDISRGKLTTIHNAIEPGEVKPTRSADEIRRELGLTDNQPVIGAAGRMVPVKGFEVFLKAAKAILKRKPETMFLLAGDGPLFEPTKQLAKTLGIDNRVHFLGFRDDITDVLNCMDIFVVSSHHEGIPTAVLEVMALGKTVVATAVGGMKEIIEPDVSGILVRPGDADAIAEACERILGDGVLREKIGNAARETVEDRFSSTVQAQKMLEIYRQVTGHRELVTD